MERKGKGKVEERGERRGNVKGKERKRKGKGKERERERKGKGRERERKGKCAVYLISRPMCIFHNSFFPLKMHSNCESLNVFQPTELWEKIIMEKSNYGKKTGLELSGARRVLPGYFNLFIFSIILSAAVYRCMCVCMDVSCHCNSQFVGVLSSHPIRNL